MTVFSLCAPSPNTTTIYNCIGDGHFPEVCYVFVHTAQSLHAATSGCENPFVIPGLTPEWFAKPYRLMHFLCCYYVATVVYLAAGMTTGTGHVRVTQHSSSSLYKAVTAYKYYLLNWV